MTSNREELTGLCSQGYYNGQHLSGVGVLADGPLHNPNSYDDGGVREAIRRAEEQKRTDRSCAAREAVTARQYQRQRRIRGTAWGIITGRGYDRRISCVICGKSLKDSKSITRKIGGNCWKQVLESISQQQPQHHSKEQV
jgi:hypothetical protein